MSERDNGIGADGWLCDFPECKGPANVAAFHRSACKIHMFSDWWKEHIEGWINTPFTDASNAHW